MNDTYHKLQLAGEEQDCAAIIATLAAIKKGTLKNDLRLLNFYWEVPVSYGAEVETVEEQSVELLVHQIQAVAIAQEKVTILKSSHFPKDVVAHVNYVNVEKSRVVLSKMSYALIRADRRMSVRVEMGKSIRATFSCQDETVEGRLHDMSLTGISIKADRDPGLELSERGELAVYLPTETVAVQASLRKIIPLKAGCRLAFQIEPTRAVELSISRYVFQRQVEIIKELKDHPGVVS